MASPVSSVSSISRVSSLERRTGDSERLMLTAATTFSARDPEQPRFDQRAAASKVNETATVEPLFSRRSSGQHEEFILDHEAKDSAQTHQMNHDTRSWYHDWWFWEIAGALLSLGSTVAIVVMLAVYNNQPLPVLRYGITLNAMLSVLSTVAKVRA